MRSCRRNSGWLLLGGLLAGCQGTSGVLPIGPNAYTLSEMRAPVVGGGQAARLAVLQDATAFCARQGRRFVLMDARPDGDPYTPYYPTAFDATFRCDPP
jgi:hypothetical protein